MTALVVTAPSAFAQPRLSDPEYVAKANDYLKVFQFETGTMKPRVTRDPGSEHTLPWVTVAADTWQVAMNEAGQFQYFQRPRGSSAPGPGGKDLFAQDEDIWVHAEKYLRQLDPPKDLLHDSIEKREGPTNPAGRPQARRWIVNFSPKPYGYPSLGNRAVFEIRPEDGKVMTAFVTRGWSHEAPNIQVEPEEATKVATETMGGAPQDWTCEKPTYQAGYKPGTQLTELTKQYTLRLCYNLLRGPDVVIVDTVSGEVVWNGTIPGQERKAANENLPLAGIGAMLVGGAGIVLAGFRLRKRLNPVQSQE